MKKIKHNDLFSLVKSVSVLVNQYKIIDNSIKLL